MNISSIGDKSGYLPNHIGTLCFCRLDQRRYMISGLVIANIIDGGKEYGDSNYQFNCLANIVICITSSEISTDNFKT